MYKYTRQVIVIISCLCLPLWAQEKNVPLTPLFTGTAEMQIVAPNLEKNPELAKIPGVSSSVTGVVLDLNLKGSFLLPSRWQVERQTGIEAHSGLGYEAGLIANIAKLYEFTPATTSYSMSSDSSGYSRIQVMIDWYEANKTRFGLPSNPFGDAGWPSSSYGSMVGRYVFIKGTQVERADDVDWTSSKWAEALQLHNDIKAKILGQIGLLSSAILSTGDVDQYVFDGLSDANKKLANQKQQAIKSFNAAYSGSTSGVGVNGPLISSAWLKITNIFSVADLRMDFLGSKLSNGNVLKTPLAAQSTTGAAVTVSLVNNLVPGLALSVASSVVGGSSQVPEAYDTSVLEYYPGLPAELGVQAKAAWSLFFPELNGEVRVAAEGIMADLMVEKTNFAAGGTVGWESKGDLSLSTEFEGQYVNWADRLIENDTATSSKAFSNKTTIDWCGISPRGSAIWKDSLYSARNKNLVEDRFSGVSAQGDFDSANLSPSLLWKAGLSVSPTYFIGMDLISVEGGMESFMYGKDLVAYGTGWFGKVGMNLYDLTELPIQLGAGASSYKNSKLVTFADMSSLPVRTMIDDMSWCANVKFVPLSTLTLELVYSSKPYLSKRQSIRESAVQLTAKIKL